MTQEDLVHQLHEEGMSAIAIHMRFVEIFSLLAIAYSTVIKIARRTSWIDNSPTTPGMTCNDQSDELILDTLENEPNDSVHQISDMTRIPATIVFNILSKRLEFISRKCKFMRHILIEKLRADRLMKGIELLPVLIQAEQTNWRFILTGDDFWFLLSREFKNLAAVRC
jgi:hypothetical protein